MCKECVRNTERQAFSKLQGTAVRHGVLLIADKCLDGVFLIYRHTNYSCSNQVVALEEHFKVLEMIEYRHL
jgi:hypothetical protein